MNMPATKLIRHGSEAGYRAEQAVGNICQRCRTGHKLYNKQYTKGGKEQGLKFHRDQVIDHLDNAGTMRNNLGSVRDYTVSVQPKSPQTTQVIPENGGAPSVTSRLTREVTSRVGAMWGAVPGPDAPGWDAGEFVPEDDTDGLRPVEPDPEPSGEDWSEVTDEEFIINAAGIKKIEDSLGTYLSIVGLTVEMVDPYCGPIAAQNLTLMVQRWARVIGQYPSAAKIFLDSKGGVLMLWIAALQSTWPVLFAIYEHHLGKTVRVQDGVIQRKNEPNSAFRGFDGTTPPMPNYNYTVD
jgi:hypothetical protein